MWFETTTQPFNDASLTRSSGEMATRKSPVTRAAHTKEPYVVRTKARILRREDAPEPNTSSTGNNRNPRSKLPMAKAEKNSPARQDRANFKRTPLSASPRNRRIHRQAATGRPSIASLTNRAVLPRRQPPAQGRIQDGRIQASPLPHRQTMCAYGAPALRETPMKEYSCEPQQQCIQHGYE